jgi:hypothetical protein
LSALDPERDPIDELQRLAVITRLLDSSPDLDVFDDAETSLICMPEPDEDAGDDD